MWQARRVAVVAMLAVVSWTGGALAALPTTSLVDGVLTSTGGSPAADGDYDIVFAIYAEASGGSAAWTETAKVKVTGGRFAHALGSVTAIDTAKLLPLPGHFLGVKVGADPELPRQKLHGALTSMVATEALAVSCDGCIGAKHVGNGAIAAAKVGFNYAGSSTKGGAAADLECSGCVNVAELKFDADVDLGGNSIKAKNGTFSGDVAAKTVTATGFVGDGSKLTGLKTPAGECSKAGEVVKGINADGSLKCVAALDPSALPKDGLNEISNDLLSNQFDDTIQGQAGVKIPDNTGSSANATLDFPDIGVSQDFELYVEVANTDLSTLALTVLPPDDKKTGWVLCDPCGKKDEKSYKVAFNSSNLPKSGDLKKWIGGNPKGLWNLKATDTSFCLPQAPGNAPLCEVTNKQDGSIVKWHVKIKTLSNKKVNLNGDVYVSGKLWGQDNGHGQDGGLLTIANATVKFGVPAAVPACDAATLGTLRWDANFGLVVCNTNPPKSGNMQYAWTIARSTPVAWQGGCGSHAQGSDWATYCLDKNEFNNASDYFSVAASGKVTMKISGHYRMYFYAIQHGCGSQNLQFLVDGSYKAYTHNIRPSASDQWHQAELEFNGPLVAGQVVEVQAYHDGCGNQYQWHSWNSGGAHSRFRLEYLGPLGGK